MHIGFKRKEREKSRNISMQMAPKIMGYAFSFKEKRKGLASCLLLFFFLNKRRWCDLEEPNLVVVLYFNCLFVCIYVFWEQFR